MILSGGVDSLDLTASDIGGDSTGAGVVPGGANGRYFGSSLASVEHTHGNKGEGQDVQAAHNQSTPLYSKNSTIPCIKAGIILSKDLER